MATNKFEAYTGGIFLEHHYFSFVSLFIIFTDIMTQSVQFSVPTKHPSYLCFAKTEQVRFFVSTVYAAVIYICVCLCVSLGNGVR